MRWPTVIALVVTLALGACASVPPSPAALDHLPALRGEYFPLDSDSGHRYHVYVRLPEGYEARPDTSWPVVYILDGDSLFPLLAPTHLFLHHDEQLPEAVLVGIGYGSFDPAINRRQIDFSAPGSDARPGEDGAPNFLAFLREQLIPRVEQHYRVDGSRRVLVGQSRAGYFVLWSALQDPDLFRGWIASNASFAPAREALLQAPATPPAGLRRVAVVSGTRDTPQRMQAAVEWMRHWQAQPAPPWQLRHFVLEGGTHAASIGEAYRNAMLWLSDEEVAAARAERAP